MIGFSGPKEVYGDFDVDILHERYVTFRSENSDDARRWVAFIDIGGKHYFGISSFAPTEDEAVAKLRILWDEKRAERERNILARREAVRKTAERKAAKKASA